MLIIFLLCAFGTFFTLLNVFTIHVIRPDISARAKSVAILIPMRNEEFNVDGVISSAQQSQGLSQWDITVLDDSSTDGTSEKLAHYDVKVLQGSPLPSGWLGKNWACHQLSHSTTAEYLVFLDADVRIHPSAIASSITKMNSLGWDFTSPYPKQIAVTFLERLIQPLLQWSWMSSVPLRIAQRLRINSMVVANGQFFIINRAAYIKAGGHEKIKTEVLDDLRLARTLVSAGYTGGVAEGSNVAECRMYESASALIEGYTKSLWTAFGGALGTLVAFALLIATQLVPLAAALSGSMLGWSAFFIMAASHALAAWRTRSAPSNTFAHPLAVLILLGLILESIRRRRTGTLVWRERTIS